MREKLKIYKFLLWLRELQEEQAKVRLYQAGIHLKNLMEEKQILEEELRSCYEHIHGKGVLNGEELRLWGNYFEVIREFQNIAESKVSTQKKIIEELTEDLKRKHQAKEVIELLYRRVKREYELLQYRKELQELDDLYLMTRRR